MEETREIEDDLQENNPDSSEETTEEVPSWEEEKEALTLQATELKDKYLRLFAEFDNYKKRTAKEKLDLTATAARNTILSLLPVVDDFDRALVADGDDSTEEKLSEGIKMTINRLYKSLDTVGLKVMESNGETFDPDLHEALTEIPAPNDDLKGKVVDTIEKGYFLKEKLIRHAKVVVGK